MNRRIPRPLALGAGGLLLFLTGLTVGSSGNDADVDALAAQRLAEMPTPTVTTTLPAEPAPTVTVTSTPPPAPTVTVTAEPLVRTVTKTAEAPPQAAAEPSADSRDAWADYSDEAQDPPVDEPGASYGNCSEARAAGVTPLHRGDPGYAPHLDRDDDGVACE
ncbi:excalibur calcium-binding domain-containing protein [Mobilicoccus massiliensis]|uniref:excalibur calcium-binding domain-containing protein n=1 Tax=Mobilicoccus massiliensis TaxID=1522310 RepID=UPI0009E38400|nr:excalibur calcium-binding domain-containing protein [Mobilicoccus massiliensis]